ncbi:MAG: cob(I)yrinic acid a,c-diamide adenosyltransferase [Candidatus Omnitrophota bacterium]|jgi:cob(I)alamin adenosyltransferase|nr:MAG: cob(I)yrinic acid a,c-diamide adenosyltransferase [Candidatus Omnitrophota bacterium]
MTRIYTRSGDDGTTALGNGARVKKDCPLVEAYGAVDELNSIIGQVLACGVADELHPILDGIQLDLFELGADLAFPKQTENSDPSFRIQPAQISALEQAIDRWEETLAPLTNFILPRGSIAASTLHHARAVCRRAERKAVGVYQNTKNNPALKYLNRLSDLLFVMARFQNQHDGCPEKKWKTQ